MSSFKDSVELDYLESGIAAAKLRIKVYAAHVVVNSFLSHPIQGWSSLMVVVLLIGGFQFVMLGVLGEYLWSALDEIRARPRYLIENCSDRAGKSSMLVLSGKDGLSKLEKFQQNVNQELACFPESKIEQKGSS